MNLGLSQSFVRLICGACPLEWQEGEGGGSFIEYEYFFCIFLRTYGEWNFYALLKGDVPQMFEEYRVKLNRAEICPMLIPHVGCMLKIPNC